MFNLDAIDNHFPIRVDDKASYREGQRKAIEFALNAFNEGKRVVLIEGPTGSGKSAIGMTLADMVHKSYYLTATKILQDQLVDEFGDQIVELKGRNAYPCTFYDRYGPEMVKRGVWKQHVLDQHLAKKHNCNDGFCKSKAGKQGKKQQCTKCFTVAGPNGNSRPGGDLTRLPLGMTYSACPYYEQVYKAVNGRKVVMNFSSFLFQTQMTTRFREPREMMVVDECHNIEPQLMDFVSLTVSDAQLQKHGIIIPELESAEEYAVFFQDSKLHEAMLKVMGEAEENDQTWLVDELSRTLKKYKMFLDHIGTEGSEWVFEHETLNGGHSRVTLKPVFVHNMAQELLFKYADRVVLMSATILDVDVMCKSLGLKREEIAAVRLKNRFPVENRPIIVAPVAKMTGGPEGMKKWGPDLVAGVNKRVNAHQGERGIIHTQSFAITKLLREKCDRTVKSRFLFQDDFNNDKKAMLAAHAKRDDSILVAPAMHEGIDLHGDLSRFQIICKVPYANFFDNEQLARRVEKDRKYYIWLTALKIVQAYGRSIRSPDDHAVTYILDEAFEKFEKEAKNMLPDWFKEAVKYE